MMWDRNCERTDRNEKWEERSNIVENRNVPLVFEDSEQDCLM